MNEFPLNPGRQARLKFAFIDAYDARAGDPAVFRRRLERLVELHQTLVDETLAEQGVIPETVAGCIAVLHVAAAIYEELNGGLDAAA